MSYLKRLILTTYVSFLGSIILYSQEESYPNNLTREEIIQLTETQYGSDDILVNGIQYLPENIRANENPNFDWDESTGTKLFIKGRSYINVDIKYDITVDQLIFSKMQENYYELKLILNSTFVDSFYLGHNLFIKLTEPVKNSKQSVYFEKIYTVRDLFLKKYKKRFMGIYDLKNPYGKFSVQKSTYYIYHQGNLIKVNSKKEFVNFYNSYRKEIKKFLRRNNIKYLNANNEELSKLMTFCHDITQPKN